MPEMKFDTIVCMPKPRPRPSAPENTVSAVTSTPTAESEARIATATKAMRASLPTSTCSDGVRSLERLTRRSMPSLSRRDSQSRTTSIARPLTSDRSEMRAGPSVIARASSSAASGSSTPRISSASRLHPMIATMRAAARLRTTREATEMATQALTSVAARRRSAASPPAGSLSAAA